MMAAPAVASMTLGELLGDAAGAHGDRGITDLVVDSRQVSDGAAFLAVPGGGRHGLDFAADALARGAAIVLYEPSAGHEPVAEPSLAVPGLRARFGELASRFFGRGCFPAELLGVTGTNGKTTVAYLIAQAMTRLRSDCAYIGTLGFGVPPALTAHELTTPDCMSLHRELAGLATTHAALEVSSHALSQNRIAGLEIGTALCTNLTRDHLDEHGDVDAYAAAKAKLFSLPALRHAVLNLDDDFAAGLSAKLPPACEGIGVSLRAAAGAELYGRYTSLGLGGTALEIGGRYGQARLQSGLIGEFNAENLLLALGGLLAWQLPLADAVAALAEAAAPPGRMQILRGRRGRATAVVDYAHTPDALERVLATLRANTAAELWCVFGCGGERDRGKRAAMGAVAGRFAEHVILTDDNPRHEDPGRILADIAAGLRGHPDVRIERPREQAIQSALKRAQGGDLVLIAGRGHEARQLIGDQGRPFDDSAVVAEALEAMA